MVHTTPPLSAGSYIYTLKVWDANDPGCFGVAHFNVTVSLPPAPPQISMNVDNCQPYQVTLAVQNPGPGQYNWSNGLSGSAIQVNTGGLYQVIYTAPSGCSATQQIMVPHSLEDLMWIFPTGCYDLCPGEGYVIGPRGSFTNHEWQYFGTSQQSNGGLIGSYWPTQTGSYQLFLDNGVCQLTSGNMDISPSGQNPYCLPEECSLDVAIEGVQSVGNGYLIYGIIHNFGSQAITVTLTSANNYGTYSPSQPITIAPGGSYQMNPVLFIPGPNFPGGSDTLMISGPTGECYVKAEIVMDERYVARTAVTGNNTASALQIAPNPAKETVRISFNTGIDDVEAVGLYIYDGAGRLRHQQKLRLSKGFIDLDVQRWPQGMYLINITTEADPLQGKLLKE